MDSEEKRFTDKVIIDDCRLMLPFLPDNFIDLTFTSPPYNVGKKYGNDYDDEKEYEFYLQTIIREPFKLLYQKTKTGGRCVINIMDIGKTSERKSLVSDTIQILKEEGWGYMGRILWMKKYARSFTAWGSWLSPSAPSILQNWEELIVFYKESTKHEPRKKGVKGDMTAEEFKKLTWGTWENINPCNAQKIGHPAPFPLELAIRVIKLFSFPGDLVCDIFAGSGTTGKAARLVNRHWLLIEQNPAYEKLINKRLAEGVSLERFFR